MIALPGCKSFHSTTTAMFRSCCLRRIYPSRNLLCLGLLMTSCCFFGYVYRNYVGSSRTNRRLTMDQNNAPVDRRPVPRIIHQSWKTKRLPIRFLRWSQSWRTCFPDWDYRLWTDEDNRRLIKEHYPWFLAKYDSLPAGIYRADAVRYFYLFHYGGIYADLDAECLRPFENLLINQSVVLGAMEGRFGPANPPEGYTQNSFIYSRVGHPIWRSIAEAIQSQRYPAGPPERFTGPIMMMQQLEVYRKSHPGREDIKIYPGGIFNPFSWMRRDRSSGCTDLNQMTDAAVTKCRAYYKSRGAFVIQYHTQTWGRGRPIS